MSKLDIEYTDKEITAYGGIAILQKMIDKMGFIQLLQSVPLPQPRSNRGYDPIQIILQFIVSIWCGAHRFDHLEVIRFDRVIQQLFGWERMAGHRSFIRFFQKFSMETNSQVFSRIFKWFFRNLSFNHFTLDFDSTVMTRYGDQEGAAKGYNPKKPGRKSHHPLMAFVSDVQLVANFWLRTGAAHTANNFEAFLQETLSYLEHKTIGLLRADSGFYSKTIFEIIESQAINYIIACPMYITLQQKIFNQKVWLRLEEGVEICEFEYQSPMWEKSRRLVSARQKISVRPKATGKTLSLFEDSEIMRGYRFSCYITNLTLPPVEVWRLYRGRANAENQIKELKYDFGLDKMNLQGFDATEASMSFIMVAYNLMSLFKQVVINDKIKPTLKTIRFRMINVASYLAQNGRNHVLKMSVHMKRRSWITKLWDSIDSMNSPFITISP
jgi:hypothetical protein